jgi:hypothetical protein
MLAPGCELMRGIDRQYQIVLSLANLDTVHPSAPMDLHTSLIAPLLKHISTP